MRLQVGQRGSEAGWSCKSKPLSLPGPQLVSQPHSEVEPPPKPNEKSYCQALLAIRLLNHLGCVCLVLVFTHPAAANLVYSPAWTVARRAPLSTGFPGRNTGVGCQSPAPGTFLAQALSLFQVHYSAVRFFTPEPLTKPRMVPRS